MFVLPSRSRFHQGLTKCYEQTGRQIVQSVESCDSLVCGAWVPKVANLWRTGGDVQNYWGSIMNNIHKNDLMAEVATPGHFNDPDSTYMSHQSTSSRHCGDSAPFDPPST